MEAKHFIYLDNAATTRPFRHLGAMFEQYAEDRWHNPSALYRQAGEARKRLEEIRSMLETALGSPQHRCVFTSGGTEGANMAITRGFSRRRNSNVVCAGFEHPCVEESFKLLGAQGVEVRFAKVDRYGSTHWQDLEELIDDNTQLLSVMHVNNETGALNDVAALAAAAKRRQPRLVVHVDGVQAFLRVPPIDMRHIDYYTVSAHKIHALKGTGALFMRRGSPLKALIVGGGQEMGQRSGTENTFGVEALGAAVSWWLENGDQARLHMRECRSRLISELVQIPGVEVLSPSAEDACAHILSVSFPGLRGETLVHMLEEDGVLAATGSACSSKKGRSRAETALGLSRETAQGTVRLSWSISNTAAEMQQASAVLRNKVEQLHRLTGR